MVAGKSGAERSGVTVVIPTTAGAIQVMGLRWLQRVAISRVVLSNETSAECERWSKDYNSLLRAGDPMRTLLGLPEAGGCRLVVSAEIDHGRSWIVPVAAAHFADARAQAVHADMARARMLIWGTGALDFSQPDTAEAAKIVENDYHLTSKIDLSREHFATAAHDGAPVLCLLPAGPDAERAATVLRKVLGQQAHHIEIVANLADVIRPIEAFLTKGRFDAPPDIKYAPVPYTPPPEAEAEPEPAATTAGAPPAGAASAEAPPVYGVKAAEPPPMAAPAKAQAASKGLSMGLLGGIAAALVAVIGVGGIMLRSGSTPTPPAPTAQQTQPTPPPRTTLSPVSSATLTVPPVVTTPQVSTPQAPLPVVSVPQTALPPVPVVSVPQTAPQPAVQPQTPPPPQTPATQTPATAPEPAAPVGRLTILTAPAGSSCQAQVMEMNPRFTETVFELGADKPVLEIDSASLCGLAVTGSGAVQARFAQGTVAGTVSSLSTAGRIVFNPSNATGRLPDIAVSGGRIDKIELRRK